MTTIDQLKRNMYEAVVDKEVHDKLDTVEALFVFSTSTISDYARVRILYLLLVKGLFQMFKDNSMEDVETVSRRSGEEITEFLIHLKKAYDKGELK